jgi:hypothetical protein
VAASAAASCSDTLAGTSVNSTGKNCLTWAGALKFCIRVYDGARLIVGRRRETARSRSIRACR